ncbi:hypothetical protein [Rheinheimera sp. 1928-s]|uniref:hypothetical protein n=1 Tax=Rheinheimera sp. 1928-s TaxID=3033803 RepID=UPI002610DA5E|nr:hypothetical protein [Rheinheimera sp. 1928-s]MDF3123830.1 hypothetical protein [Rheinheimera sp. 1928-s]
MKFYLTTRQYNQALSVVALLSFCALLMLALWPTPTLKLNDYDSMECRINSASEGAVLSVVGSPVNSLSLGKQLCDKTELAAHFGRVKVSWPKRTELTADALISGQYQLLWSRREVLAGALHNLQDYYSEILIFPKYPVYFVSKQQSFQLSKTFLTQQRFGFLTDVNSYSGFQLPVALLQREGLTLADINYRQYDDWTTLLAAFEQGEITIYSSVLLDKHQQVVQQGADQVLYTLAGTEVLPEQRQLIPGYSNGGSWFLHKSLEDKGCLLQRSLLTLDEMLSPTRVDLDCET